MQPKSIKGNHFNFLIRAVISCPVSASSNYAEVHTSDRVPGPDSRLTNEIIFFITIPKSHQSFLNYF